MSRLSTLSPTALQAMFGQETDKELILLLTIYDPSNPTQVVLRLADGFTQRISETADDVMYGVVSRGNNYIFLPMEVTMPDESDSSAPKCSIVLHDVTRYVMPVARSINGQPKVKLELVVSSTPDIVEVVFTSFYITNFSYTVDRVTIELSMIGYEREPFPQYSFNPVYFPGLF
jgi:hypothetical protein